MNKPLYILLGVAVAVSVLSSCDSTYPRMYVDSDDNAGVTGESSVLQTPVRLYISTPNFVNVSANSGVGALDNTEDAERYKNHYCNMLLHTYAYRCTAGGADFTRSLSNEDGAENCLVSSLVNKEGMPTRLIDRYPDGKADGQLMYFYESASTERPLTLYYNPDRMEEGYNFFAYTWDNAVVLHQLWTKAASVMT